MITAGVDLASQPKHTFGCRLTWGDRVEAAFLPRMSDEEILDLARRSDKAGVDSPFGWPESFVEAVGRHHRGGGPWTAQGRELRFRRTDLDVRRHAGRDPLSVSTDRIAFVAIRCARLQSLWQERTGERVDRTGRGRWVEVYPAAALAVWGLESKGYKLSDRLRSSVDHLVRQAPWLDLSDEDRVRLGANHHAFDALVCALVARAAALGRTHPPPPEDEEPARREGWIHVPAADLTELGA